MSAIAWKETKFLRVPLTDDEIRARGQQLADALAQRDTLLGEHEVQKEAMKIARGAIDGQIHRLAQVVRDAVEERSVEVEIRLNVGLRMVEEVRLDTGEIVTTRHATEDDKLRAAARIQPGLPLDAPEPDPRA